MQDASIRGADGRPVAMLWPVQIGQIFENQPAIRLFLMEKSLAQSRLAVRMERVVRLQAARNRKCRRDRLGMCDLIDLVLGDKLPILLYEKLGWF